MRPPLPPEAPKCSGHPSPSNRHRSPLCKWCPQRPQRNTSQVPLNPLLPPAFPVALPSKNKLISELLAGEALNPTNWFVDVMYACDATTESAAQRPEQMPGAAGTGATDPAFPAENLGAMQAAGHAFLDEPILRRALPPEAVTEAGGTGTAAAATLEPRNPKTCTCSGA